MLINNLVRWLLNHYEIGEVISFLNALIATLIFIAGMITCSLFYSIVKSIKNNKKLKNKIKKFISKIKQKIKYLIDCLKTGVEPKKAVIGEDEETIEIEEDEEDGQ